MPRRPPETVLELCLARGGVRKGARVGGFIASWAIAQKQLGHEPHLAEYVRYWKGRQRTEERYLAEFRELFPELGPDATPSPIAAAIIAEYEDRMTGSMADLAAVPADLVLV